MRRDLFRCSEIVADAAKRRPLPPLPLFALKTLAFATMNCSRRGTPDVVANGCGVKAHQRFGFLTRYGRIVDIELKNPPRPLVIVLWSSKVLDMEFPAVRNSSCCSWTTTYSFMARYEPTFYGRLLDSLPLSFDASVLALRFGEIGLLQQGIMISILMDIHPLPVLQPFGNPDLFTKYVSNYFDVNSSNTLEATKKETALIGNLCAFQFWQHVFKVKM